MDMECLFGKYLYILELHMLGVWFIYPINVLIIFTLYSKASPTGGVQTFESECRRIGIFMINSTITIIYILI